MCTESGRCLIFAMQMASDYLARLARAARRMQAPRVHTAAFRRRFTGDREFGRCDGVSQLSRSQYWFRNRVDSRCRDGAVTTRSSCYGYYLASRLNSGVSVD